MQMRRIGVALAALIFIGAGARADEVADFYKGRQVSVIVGYGTGGGYDVYGRLLARHLGRHIPGTPHVVVQNMPGAGSLRAVNYIYNTAPKDGTALAIFARDMPLLGIIGGNANVRFDARKLTWLGSSSSYANDAYFMFVRKDAQVKSIEDARRAGGPPIVLGGTAEGATGNDIATVVRDALGLNIKLIAGYPDSNALFLAVDRKELDGRFVGLSATSSSHPEWLTPNGGCKSFCSLPASRGIRIFLTFRRRESSRLATNPSRWLRWPNCLIVCRGLSPLRRLARGSSITLQKAFLEVHRDPQYLEEAARLKVDVSPIGGHEVVRAIDGHRRCTARTARIHEEAPGREQRRRLSVRAGVCRPQEPSVVLQVYAVEGGKLKARPHDAASLGAAVWIDLADPTGDEQSVVERATGIHIQTPDELDRFYISDMRDKPDQSQRSCKRWPRRRNSQSRFARIVFFL